MHLCVLCYSMLCVSTMCLSVIYVFFLMIRRPPRSTRTDTLFPYTTLFRSPAMISRQVAAEGVQRIVVVTDEPEKYPAGTNWAPGVAIEHRDHLDRDRKSTRLNSSH